MANLSTSPITVALELEHLIKGHMYIMQREKYSSKQSPEGHFYGFLC